MAHELQGKVAVITGAASGIGRATAELFVSEGAKVVIADLDVEGGEAVAAKLGDAAIFKRTDVGKADDVQALVDHAVSRFGGLHVMFNNAGVNSATTNHFLTDDLADFDFILRVNLLGVMIGSQRAAQHMAKNGGGSIINTSSIAGVLAGYAFHTYRTAKAGVAHFSKSIAIDLAAHNIRVNCIAPGHIMTEMTTFSDPGMSAADVARIEAALAPVWTSNQPLKQRGQAIDVANAALYFASDRSAYVTGQIVAVDGGVTSGDPVNHIEEFGAARAKALAS